MIITAMFLWFLFLGSVLSIPTDEFRELTKKGVEDFLYKSDKVNIVPGYVNADRGVPYSNNNNEDNTWIDLINSNPSNKYLKHFNSHIEKGTTSKALTFCIYDNNMREAAIALFRLFQTTEGDSFLKVKEWAKDNVNREMFMYALRLEALYTSKTNQSKLVPPYIWNPSYFVNSDTLTKASMAAEEVNIKGFIDEELSKVYQYKYASRVSNKYIIVNTNYSGWNLPTSRKENYLNYFREDVALNSYYLGVHLLHPFWMSNEELEFNNPRFAEHYYYAHQQLMARYNLEKLHMQDDNGSFSSDGWDYIPYLRYKNGLPFPTRSCLRGDWDTERSYLKTIDIAIRECISRGLIIMQNGTTLTMTDDSHINILAKLIRANLDGIKVAKIARSIIGYGGNTYPIDEYNSAPSILHHPETSLRDPAYWLMLQYMLNYFSDYKKTMEPFDLSQYESEHFGIIDHQFSKLTTLFDHHRFPINAAFSNFEDKDAAILSVKQRRLSKFDFSFNFTVESVANIDTVVRLYIGPECSGNDCWNQYDKFFELDTFEFTLIEGVNLIPWCSVNSDRVSNDAGYNSPAPVEGSTDYSIFRFPSNLLLPRGLEEGLNLTLFVMITPTDEDTIPYPPSFYREVSTELDSKPLGFPFHRQAKNVKEFSANYKFYNITVFHYQMTSDSDNSYFSPNLY